MDELLTWLQDTYADLCNESWEHEHGFDIYNIDNPGWEFRFDIRDLDIAEIPLEVVDVKNNEADWYHCMIKDEIFIGLGGAKNLIDILKEFRKWFTTAVEICDEKCNNPDGDRVSTD